jgi:thiosulfate/3-mercaptopyruvate sulfurtransferase
MLDCMRSAFRPSHFVFKALRSLPFLLLAAPGFGQEKADPWPKSDLLEAPALASILKSGKPPMIISVAFPVLYRSKHIVHAVDAGAGSKPEGIATLKKLVANAPKDADIVLYCGCCPMDKCPNVRPAYRALKDMGYTRVRVLNIPTNMHTDWYTKNYPSEPGVAANTTP